MDKSINLLQVFVKHRRQQHKLTQQQLAAKSGVGLRFIRDMEQGKVSLRMDKVNQVLLMFGHELGPVPIDRNKLTNEKSQGITS
jgi:y4mF family transcriptional regulator